MKTLLLDAGHGGTASGAQAEGIKEKDLTLSLVLSVGRRLESMSPKTKVVFTRVSDETLSLGWRLEAIMDHEPDAFVSVHCNSIPDDPSTLRDERESVEGYEIFYRDNNDVLLATEIDRLFYKSGLWRRRRGIKQDQECLGKKLTVLNHLEVPSVLVEVGFLSNLYERGVIINNLPGISDLLAHGIFNFLYPESVEVMLWR